MIDRSENMRRIKGRNSKPELIVRRFVYGLGFRYRLHVKSLPGCPDLVFWGRKKVIFVHGCFWHGHRDCRVAHVPRSNQDYWVPKIRRNIERDLRNVEAIQSLGWDTLVLWECELKDLACLRTRILTFLRSVS
jgi:DNA mismatch endonuclease (patch repair protein)